MALRWHERIKQYIYIRCRVYRYMIVYRFSRKILMLKVVKQNDNPIAPGALRLSAMEAQGVCLNLPMRDRWSENDDIAEIYCFMTGSNLHHRHDAPHSSQCIENWWSHSKCSFSVWVKDCS